MNNDDRSVAIPVELHSRLSEFAQRHELGEIDSLVCDILCHWLEEQEDKENGDGKRAVKTSPDIRKS